MTTNQTQDESASRDRDAIDISALAALDRLRTIVDEQIAMQPVLGWDALLGLVEKELSSHRQKAQRASTDRVALDEGVEIVASLRAENLALRTIHGNLYDRCEALMDYADVLLAAFHDVVKTTGLPDEAVNKAAEWNVKLVAAFARVKQSVGAKKEVST